jgi:hypothetical protein
MRERALQILCPASAIWNSLPIFADIALAVADLVTQNPEFFDALPTGHHL